MSVAQKASAKKNGGVRAAVPPKNVQIVKKAYEAFGRRDIPAVLEVLDPKIEWLEPAGCTGWAEVEAPCVQIWRLRGGKAVRMQNYTDTYQLAQALGR